MFPLLCIHFSCFAVHTYSVCGRCVGSHHKRRKGRFRQHPYQNGLRTSPAHITGWRCTSSSVRRSCPPPPPWDLWHVCPFLKMLVGRLPSAMYSWCRTVPLREMPLVISMHTEGGTTALEGVSGKDEDPTRQLQQSPQLHNNSASPNPARATSQHSQKHS